MLNIEFTPHVVIDLETRTRVVFDQNHPTGFYQENNPVCQFDTLKVVVHHWLYPGLPTPTSHFEFWYLFARKNLEMQDYWILKNCQSYPPCPNPHENKFCALLLKCSWTDSWLVGTKEHKRWWSIEVQKIRIAALLRVSRVIWELPLKILLRKCMSVAKKGKFF